MGEKQYCDECMGTAHFLLSGKPYCADCASYIASVCGCGHAYVVDDLPRDRKCEGCGAKLVRIFRDEWEEI